MIDITEIEKLLAKAQGAFLTFGEQLEAKSAVAAVVPELLAFCKAQREALEPFAKAAESIPDDRPDTNIVASVPGGVNAGAFANMARSLTAGNFRRARTLAPSRHNVLADQVCITLDTLEPPYVDDATDCIAAYQQAVVDAKTIVRAALSAPAQAG